jgi:anti-sigma regulatory factor (Ser/Thr protein kinase)
VSVVREGLERDERLIVLAAQDKIDDVQDALGKTADDVALVATDDHGRNPSRITTLLHSFQSAGDGRPSLGVQATALAGRSSAAIAEVLLGEHVLNDPALRWWQLSMICLYDITELDERVALSMRQCHRTIRDGSNGSATSPDYQPDGAATVLATPLDAPPTDAARVTVASGQLGRARAFVRGAAGTFHIDPDRVDDLVLAVNEAVTNSIRFGGGRAELAIFSDGNAVVCDVRDEGRITDPLIGRIAPLPSATDGRGMWLVNQLCDLVQIRSGADGTAVRVFVER